jgi:CYTH domain-containing protein/CHAD domain-containing protein
VAYVLEPTASVTHGVRRVALERIDEALDRLENLDDPADIEHAVHDVRKRCKEARALARLARSALGDEFDRFNRLVRDAAETLAPIRDAHAVLATFDDLRASGDHDSGLDEIRTGQVAVADAATDNLHSDDPRIKRARKLLIASHKSVERWSIRNGFAALSAGVNESYTSGVRDLERAVKKPSDDRLHEWRKSVKTLWYQMRLLQRAAPSAIEPIVENLDALAEALGDDHDLAVLIEHLKADPDRFGGKGRVKQAVRLARSQQDDLRRRAFRLGATVYAETPRAFTRRIDRYWRNTAVHGPEVATGGIAELAEEEQRLAMPSSEGPPDRLIERERKFLVAEAPELPKHGTTLRQGYLAIDRSVSVRVRDAAAEGCTLTIKAGRGAVRTELEWPITEQQFTAAWEQTPDRRVHKTRYRLPLTDGVIELDVFHGELGGLVLAEIEFGCDESMAAFEPPPWFGAEVTDNVAYTNASLAVNGAPLTDVAAD